MQWFLSHIQLHTKLQHPGITRTRVTDFSCIYSFSAVEALFFDLDGSYSQGISIFSIHNSLQSVNYMGCLGAELQILAEITAFCCEISVSCYNSCVFWAKTLIFGLLQYFCQLWPYAKPHSLERAGIWVTASGCRPNVIALFLGLNGSYSQGINILPIHKSQRIFSYIESLGIKLHCFAEFTAFYFESWENWDLSSQLI